MSSTKRRRVGICDDGTAPAESPLPFLPFDLLLEIFARSDAATLFRCAATSKPVRRAILDPDFRRRLALLRAEAGDRRGFDPALFLGLSYRFEHRSEWGRQHATAQEERHRRGCLSFFDADRQLSSYEPMASRGWFVVLKRHGTISAEVRVVNCLTGQVTRVRPPWVAAMYPRTLLAVGDGGSSFQLLVADTDLRMQVFSSEHGQLHDKWGHGKWGHVVEPRLPPNFFRTYPNPCSPALVLGGGSVVHWLCRDKGIIALDVGAARATAIELPPLCFEKVKRVKGADSGILVPSADGRLSLLVAELTLISMWTLSSDLAGTRWSRQVVIQSQAIARGRRDFRGRTVRFVRFGERSGTVMLHIEQVGLVQLNLRSREALVVSDQCTEIGTCSYSRLQLCLHETDLPTLMKNMKPF